MRDRNGYELINAPYYYDYGFLTIYFIQKGVFT